jgi:hypothetical protein
MIHGLMKAYRPMMFPPSYYQEPSTYWDEDEPEVDESDILAWADEQMRREDP